MRLLDRSDWAVILLPVVIIVGVLLLLGGAR